MFKFVKDKLGRRFYVCTKSVDGLGLDIYYLGRMSRAEYKATVQPVLDSMGYLYAVFSIRNGKAAREALNRLDVAVTYGPPKPAAAAKKVDEAGKGMPWN